MFEDRNGNVLVPYSKIRMLSKSFLFAEAYELECRLLERQPEDVRVERTHEGMLFYTDDQHRVKQLLENALFQ